MPDISKKNPAKSGSMNQPAVFDDGNAEVYSSRKNSAFYDVASRLLKNKTAIVGMVIIGLVVLMAIFGPLVAPYEYDAIDPLNAKATPSAEHWFGTDLYGRDMFSRILYGARYSLLIGLSSGLMGCLIGVILGSIAGFFGGKIETVILRICDIIQSIPSMLLSICISVVLGSSFFATVVALSFYNIPGLTRLLRATMLSVRDQEFVEAARAINCSKLRTMVYHVLPNCMSPVIINFSMSIGMRIMSSAGLSFLGLGIQEPTPEWGAMIAAGKSLLRYAPHIVVIPGIFVALLVLAFNMFGDGLRDALDPKLRT